jgi:hypothetical protein
VELPLVLHVFPVHRAFEHHVLSVEHHQKCISFYLFKPGTRLLENTLHCVCGWINSYISDCGKNFKLRKPHPLLMPNFHEIWQQMKIRRFIHIYNMHNSELILA